VTFGGILLYLFSTACRLEAQAALRRDPILPALSQTTG
jgi:hypothetical protein